MSPDAATVEMNLHEELVEQEGFREQTGTPYFDGLLHYVTEGTIPFHVPGHQQGRGTPKEFRDFVKEYGLAADITQVLGLDDIHQPLNVCKKAQELAAKAYGADYTYFLINGSSSGNHAMILSVCNPGDKIIVPRNAHRSTTGALILSGAIPVYVEPEFDFEMQVDHNVTTKTLEMSLIDNPDAVAVLIVSPTYYGATADIKGLVDLIHKHHKVAMVDEAWGAHLRFHPELPLSALQAGADICVNSTHKIIAGMSQASMLHVRSGRVDVGRVHSVLRLFLSTSPSCLLVASLDVARKQMATEGKKLLTRTIALAAHLREEINTIPGMHCYGREIIGRPGVFDFDPTRIVFTARELGYTGYDMEKILRYDFNIQIELSDIFNNIALVTIGHNEGMIEALIRALREVSRTRKYPTSMDKIEQYRSKQGKRFELPDWPPSLMIPRDAFVAKQVTIPFNDSEGFICGELVTPYPPGIPILRPGDLITRQIIDYITIEVEGGAHIQGPVDYTMGTIRVVENGKR
ncbi:MAG: aminotransferase class V-fold PLP-dependent enzyme [Candidatus Eremiobacteraeota bacterium]|nr:aminotransferase class V-fold PLP-dependent enzyme [Candidatus Eremiobacteraeota bacterium]